MQSARAKYRPEWWSCSAFGRRVSKFWKTLLALNPARTCGVSAIYKEAQIRFYPHILSSHFCPTFLPVLALCLLTAHSQVLSAYSASYIWYILCSLAHAYLAVKSTIFTVVVSCTHFCFHLFPIVCSCASSSSISMTAFLPAFGAVLGTTWRLVLYVLVRSCCCARTLSVCTAGWLPKIRILPTSHPEKFGSFRWVWLSDGGMYVFAVVTPRWSIGWCFWDCAGVTIWHGLVYWMSTDVDVFPLDGYWWFTSATSALYWSPSRCLIARMLP